MDTDRLASRRRFLGRAALFAVGAAGLGALLAACGGAPVANPTAAPKAAEPAKPAATTAAAPPAAAPAKGGARTLQYWTFMDTEQRFAGRKDLFPQWEQKESAKIELNFVDFAEMDKKVLAGFAAKQLPDILDPGITQMSVGWGKAGIVQDVGALLKQIGSNDFYEPLVNALTHRGKLYGIPYMANPQLLFYRKDWYADKGVKPPTNYDEWTTAAKAFTGKNPAGKDGYGFPGFLAQVHAHAFWQNFIGPNDGAVFDKDWKIVLDTLPNNAEALEQVKRVKEYMQPGAVNNSYGDTNNLFNDEVLAMNMSSTTFVNGVIKTKQNLVDKIGIIKLPFGPSSSKKRGGFLGCYSFVITTTTQAQDLANSFLTWFFSPDIYIQAFKTIDFGHMPVRQSIAQNPKLKEIVPPLAYADIQAGHEANLIATLTGEDYGVNPLAKVLTAEGMWAKTLQRVYGGEDPKSALKWAAGQIKQIAEDNKDLLG
jgi:ABC-type glycerol-3-phosphate transport system substrate-binding protein